MARIKIPKSARKTLKKALIEDGGQLADAKQKQNNETRRKIRQGIRSGEIKRTKVTWAVNEGDLVKIKSNSRNKSMTEDEDDRVIGIVVYKHVNINYKNQEDEYLIVMTPHNSGLRLSPKSVEAIQKI